MKEFDQNGKEKKAPQVPFACIRYEMLRDERYSNYPYEKKSLGEDMYVINQVVCGYWKPRYLIDERNKTAKTFMAEDASLQTVGADDIDWDSLNGLPETVIDRAKYQDAIFPTFIYKYKDGIAEVSWQINPDGRYYMDEDGFGMTNDVEITLEGAIDREGNVVRKFALSR